LRRAGVPALAGDDPVFYRRPVDTFDAEGFLVARQVRPMTRRRLTSLTSRVRQHGGPALSASAVRALSIRLIRAAGGDAEAECGQCCRRNRRLFSGLRDRAAGDGPGSTSR
jgi:hypothetical protein